jgi:hypothetical protein
MKKLPLAVAMVSLFALSNSFAEYYNQDFEISLNIPSSVDVEAFQRQTVNLSMDDLSEAMNSDGVLIGSMNIRTTARHCSATIATDNNFQLMGTAGGLPYTIDYIATSDTGNSTTNFSHSNDMEQIVGCNMGDLKLRLSRTEQGIQNMYGVYNDIIHVMVRAES